MSDRYDSQQTPHSRGGFTLIELLLVLGMMTLIASALGVWFSSGMFTERSRPTAEIFYTAAAEARLLAFSRGKPVRLWFDEEAQGFRVQVVEPAAELLLVGEPLPWEEQELRWRGNRSASQSRDAEAEAAEQKEQTAAELTRFFPLTEGSATRVAFFALYGEERARLGLPLDAIIYHPSGASTPVEVVLEDAGTRSTEVLQPDAFANGPHIERNSNRTAGFTSTGGSR